MSTRTSNQPGTLNLKVVTYLIVLVAIAALLGACTSNAPQYGLSGEWRGSASNLPVRLELKENSDGSLTGHAWYDFGSGDVLAGDIDGSVLQASDGGASVSFTNAFNDGSGSANYQATLDTNYAERQVAQEMTGVFTLRYPSGQAVLSVGFMLVR